MSTEATVAAIMALADEYAGAAASAETDDADRWSLRFDLDIEPNAGHEARAAVDPARSALESAIRAALVAAEQCTRAKTRRRSRKTGILIW
jgi:hypothetical protein